MNRVTPDVDAFEVRAAIVEFGGGLSGADAEQLAAQCQVYDNVGLFRVALAATPRRGTGKAEALAALRMNEEGADQSSISRVIVGRH